MGPIAQVARHSSRPVIFPYLKDKTPLLASFHRDKSLPFNILRDVLQFPQIQATEMDALQHAWLLYVSMNDSAPLKQLVKSGPERVWKASIRLANASPMIMNGAMGLWRDVEKRREMKMLDIIPELVVSSLIYHQKYDAAVKMFDAYVKDKGDEIQWKTILDVCLSMEGSEGMKTFSRMYEAMDERRVYSQVLQHLRELRLNDQYVNRWNNTFVAAGDIPLDSSFPHMNREFATMLQTGNIRSMKNCLKNLSKCPRPFDWLHPSSNRQMVKYITKSKDQTSALFDVLRVSANFNIDFWADLYRYTSIPTTVLDHRSEKAGFMLKTPEISSARLQRLAMSEEFDQFWDTLAQESRRKVLDKSSLTILDAAIKTSTDLERPYDHCIHLLSLHPELKDVICKTFIVECTKRIRRDQIQSNVLVRLEEFLEDNSLMTPAIHNYFIYSELSLLSYHSAITRLEHLLTLPDSKVDVKTMENVIRRLVKSQKHKTSEQDLFDDNISYRILDLTLKCLEHSPDCMNSKSWNRIMKIVGDTYGMDEISRFCVGVADRLKRTTDLNVSTSNINHPLHQAFDSKMIKTILEWGFTKTPDNPWSGYELIRNLESLGVHVPENLARTHLLRLTKVLHQTPDHQIPKRLRSEERCAPVRVATTVDRINEIYRTAA